MLGAHYAPGSLDFLRGNAIVAASPLLAFLDARNTAGAGLIFPVDVFSQFNAGFFGPSLILDAVSVPEPASAFALAVGLTALLARRRRS